MCAHHDVPAFAETSVKPYPNFLTEQFLFNRGKRPGSYWRVHTNIITGEGGIGRKETSHVVTLCVRRVLPPHTIAALFAALSNSRMHSESEVRLSIKIHIAEISNWMPLIVRNCTHSKWLSDFPRFKSLTSSTCCLSTSLS